MPYTYDDDDKSRVTPGTLVKGRRTIGYSFNLDQAGASQMTAAAGLNHADLVSGIRQISTKEAARLAQQIAVERADLLLRRFKDDLDKIDRNQWIAMMSLAYNGPKLIGPGLMQAVREGDVDSAIWEIACNSMGKVPAHLKAGVQRRRAIEAARYAGVRSINQGQVCSGGRPTPGR